MWEKNLIIEKVENVTCWKYITYHEPLQYITLQGEILGYERFHESSSLPSQLQCWN